VERIYDAYKKQEPLLNEKSRQMGFSWLYMAFFLWGILYDESFSGCVLSYKEDLVDDGGMRNTPDSLLGKLRFMYERLDERLGFKGVLEIKSLRISNKLTGAYIVGTSTTTESGRGGTYRIALWDEAARTPKSETILASIQQAARSLHLNSTVKGKGNAFARLRWSKDFGAEHVVTSHWRLHPERQKGLRQVNGKWTSEWYERQKKILTPTQLAQELDINYSESVEGRVWYKFSVEHHASQRIEYDPTWETILAWDLGLADETVILVLCRDFNKRIALVDSYINSEQTIRFYISLVQGHQPEDFDLLPYDQKKKTLEFIQRARERDYRRKIQVVGPDALQRGIKSKKSVRDQMRNAHLINRGFVRMKVTVISVGVMNRIALVNKIMDPVAGRFYVDKDQLEVIERLMNYRRKEGVDGNYTDEPIHDWASHASDALGYGVAYFEKHGRIVGNKPRGM